MNMGLLVQDVMYGETIHKILCEIDEFHAALAQEMPLAGVLNELKDCPSLRQLMSEVDRRTAFRIIIRELHFRYTSTSPGGMFPVIIILLLMLGQEHLIKGSNTVEFVVQAAESESVRWILIGHELGYLDCPDMQEEYKAILGATYNHWVAETKSSDEYIARGSFNKINSKVNDRRSSR